MIQPRLTSSRSAVAAYGRRWTATTISFALWRTGEPAFQPSAASTP